MATFKLSGLLEVVFEDVEIEADSEEEALQKLYKKDVVDIIDECYIKESNIKEEEAELTDCKIRIKVHNIDWDITEDDVEDALDVPLEEVEDVDQEIRKIARSLDFEEDGTKKEWFFTVDVDADMDIIDFEETVADMISAESGYCIRNYDYDVCDEDQELFKIIKKR